MDKEDLHIHLFNGWEISSHGRYHAFLVYNKVKRIIKRYTNKIDVEKLQFVEEQYEYILCDYKESKKEQIEINYIIIKKTSLI